MGKLVITYRHEFVNEDDVIVSLTDITYEVLQTFVDVEHETDASGEEVINTTIMFTHVVRVRPESIELNLRVRYPNG